jgi:hypothetical protein
MRCHPLACRRTARLDGVAGIGHLGAGGVRVRSEGRGCCRSCRDDHERELARARARGRGGLTGRNGARAETRLRRLGCERNVEREIEAGRAGTGLRSLQVLPATRVAESPTRLGVLESTVAGRALEIGADLRYARHRSRSARLAAGRSPAHARKKARPGKWQRGRHSATNCGGSGTHAGAGVLTPESKRRRIR